MPLPRYGMHQYVIDLLPINLRDSEPAGKPVVSYRVKAPKSPTLAMIIQPRFGLGCAARVPHLSRHCTAPRPRWMVAEIAPDIGNSHNPLRITAQSHEHPASSLLRRSRDRFRIFGDDLARDQGNARNIPKKFINS